VSRALVVGNSDGIGLALTRLADDGPSPDAGALVRMLRWLRSIRIWLT
jgi:hypothetical protein